MTVEYAQQEAIVQCAKHCEQALTQADIDHSVGAFETEAFWRERAAWWSERAFREVQA